jgi:uncharacterized SAM-binding protein YcdF (DUF218 family)
VLGYSDWRHRSLHPVCAARLEAGERAAEGADAVLLSGWARTRRRETEAALMRAAWRGPEVPLLVDDARTTAGNARAVAAAAQELGADEVVVVTSSWHRVRARLLLRAALGPDVTIEVVSPPRSRRPLLVGREGVCLLLLPIQLGAARRARRRSLPAPLPGR